MPTPKQIANIDARVKRKKDPLPFSEAWVANFVYSKFGAATTHWAKLEHRVERGVGNPCHLLLIGLPASNVVIDKAKVEQLSEDEVSTDPVTAESEAAAAAAAAAPTPL